MASTRIAHISDLHLAPLPDNTGPKNFKQFLGYLSWKSKRQYRHSEHVLNLLKEDIRTHKFDHICVSGDQTNLGTEKEFRNSSIWMQGIGAPEKVSVIPGNHDAYGNKHYELSKLYWSPWMLDRDSHGVGLPFVRQVGNVAVIGVSSAVWTAPFMANGRVTPAHYEALEESLASLDEDSSLYKMLMIHHPPLAKVTSWRRGLRDVKQFQELLIKHGVDMVLYGHLHKPLRHKLIYNNKEMLFLGAASASSNGYHASPAQYYSMEIDQQDGQWTVDIKSRAYNPEKDRFEQTDLPTEQTI
mgnify:CR=1 FL=1